MFAGKHCQPLPSKYDLVANVVHEGEPVGGTYRVHVHRNADANWYRVEDLVVEEIMSHQVVLTQAYMQVYELKQ